MRWWGQGLVAFEAGIQIQQGFTDRLGLHQGGDSAERVGTGQRPLQKAAPERAGVGLLDGIETAQASDDHHQQAADDDRGGNLRLGTHVGEAAEQ